MHSIAGKFNLLLGKLCNERKVIDEEYESKENEAYRKRSSIQLFLTGKFSRELFDGSASRPVASAICCGAKTFLKFHRVKLTNIYYWGTGTAQCVVDNRDFETVDSPDVDTGAVCWGDICLVCSMWPGLFTSFSLKPAFMLPPDPGTP